MFVTVSACIALFLSVGLFVYIATLFICYMFYLFVSVLWSPVGALEKNCA